MICPICGKKHTDETKKETTEVPNICPPCRKTAHKTMRIQCVIETGPNGLSKQDGTYLLDQLTKVFVSRGLAPLDIDFLEPYVWMDVEIQPDEIKKLQKEGVLQS
jgi:hypothetical protein